MSQYTYNHQEQKASGIQFPAMLTQKNGQRYKMVSAEDIAWNVEMKDGSLINDTDDLLNYISKTSSTTEEIVNKTFTTYRIDCDVTVCYEGDKFEQNPAIRVYKIIDGVSTLLSYEDVLNNLLIPSTNSTASTCIIKYDEEGQYLNGIAETGIHILSLKREDTVVARLQITVLSRPESVHSTTIYTESQTIPKTPVGGSYEDGVFIAPIGWTTDVMSLNQDNTIWFSTGTVFSNNNTAIWSAPCMYITKEAVQNTDKYYSNGVAVYKVVSTKKLVYEYNEDTFIYEYKLVTNTDPVLPPDNQEGDYEFSTGVITAPSEWEISPQKAVEQYFESIEQLIITNPSLKDYYIKQKYAYKIYVSFNTYTTAYNGSVYFDKASIGWTTPVEYLNIDDVLENAKATSNSITKDAFDQARKDLNNVSNEINKKLNDTEENIHTINSKIKSLQDSVKDYTQVGAIVDSLKSLYSWNRVDPPVNGNYEYKIINNYSYDVFITLDAYTGKEWYDKYVYLTVEDKYYQYSASSVMLTTELYALKSSVEGNGNRISTLEASVNEMTPDKIRLQVSKGFLNNVTWTPIEDSTVDHIIVIEEKPSTDLISYLVDNVTDPIFGDTYKLKFSYTDSDTGLTINKEYSYRCDYPISTGFLNILSDNLSLGVSQNIDGSIIKSYINLTVGKEGSTITSEASKIILNGDVIAEAIKTKELNINNTTYLSGNGDVKFAQGNDKRGSIFNSDGTGSLAGGLISWENTGDLSVKGKITATSGYIGNGDNAWFIGTVKGIPAIYAIDGDNKISITTQYLEGGLEATPSWRILRDGTATFAKGNVMFNNDGSGYIGIHDNTTGETKGLTIDNNGNVSLTGIDVTINASGIADLTSTIKNTVTGDTEVVGVIANAAADQVNVLGRLKTEDVEVGNGACFFKGSFESTDVPKYGKDEQGSGFVANGNIKWDKYGNINIGSVGGTCNQELTDIKLKKRGVLVPANRLSTVAEDYKNNVNDYVYDRPLGHYDMSEYIYISKEDYNNAIEAENIEIETSVLTQSQYYKLSSDERRGYIGLPVYGDYVHHTCKQKGFYICTKKQNESTLIYLDYQDGSFPRVTSMAELRRQIRIRQIGQWYINLLVTDSTDGKQYPCYMISEDDTTNEGYDKNDYLQDVLGKGFPIYVHNVPWTDGPTDYLDGNVISIKEGEDSFNTYFKKAYDVGYTVYNLDYLMYTDSTHNDGVDTGLVYLGDTTQEQSIKFAINATGREEGNAPGRKTSVGNILHFKSGVYYGGFSTDKYGENSRSYNIDMFFGEVRNADLNNILWSSYGRSTVVQNILTQYKSYNGPMMICPLAMPTGNNPDQNGYDGGTDSGYSIMAPGIFGAIHALQAGDPDTPINNNNAWVFTGFFNGNYYRKG